jgi:hypothetical protein
MCFYFENAEAIQLGSKEQFEQITGAQWIDEIRISPFADQGNYTLRSTSDFQLMQLALPFYHFYKKNPPKLCIRLGLSKGGNSLISLESIGRGSVVAEYLGEWLPNSNVKSSYRWGPIDALYYRNCSSIVEDGFPNLGAFHLYGVGGIPLRIVFVALEEIKVGEMLTIHYGMNHSVKTSYHIEYNLEKMNDYFSKNPLDKIVKRIRDLRVKSPKELGWKRTIELEGLVAKLRYLYQTPGALATLLFEGIIKAKDAFTYYQSAEFKYFLAGFSMEPNSKEREIVSYIDALKNVLFVNQKTDLLAVSLLDEVRHRVFFLAYLPLIVAGKSFEVAHQEAYIWNETFDAIEQGMKETVEFNLEKVFRKKELIKVSITYAAELNSPLISWLRTLDDSPFEFRPTG